MAGLLSEEGDRDVGFDGDVAQHPARVAVQACGHVDRENRNVQFVEFESDGFGFVLKLAREACAEHGVDHQFGIAEDSGSDGFETAIPQLGHGGDIAFEIGAAAEHGDANIPAVFLQIARGDKAIAAIVARAAEHQCLARTPMPDGFIGHGAARVLHEREKGNAVLGGVTVGSKTLFDGKDFALHKTR